MTADLFVSAHVYSDRKSMSKTRNVALWRYKLWARFMRLPEPAYYRLGDLLVNLDGWRPLHMRYPEQFGRSS